MRMRKLTPSVISSFSVFGKETDEQLLTKDCEYIEVYAFMHQCLPVDSGRNQSALDYLANAHQEDKTAEVAEKILQRAGDRKVSALATFLPELSVGEEGSVESGKAMAALRALIDVARYLGAKGHPVQSIEMVSGSRINGLFKSKLSNESYYARRRSRQAALEMLLKRLQEVAAYAMATNPIFLGVELEPGPLYVLSDKAALGQLATMIKETGDEALNRCVGFNLDIPHWHFLAGITPQWLKLPQNRNIVDRIVHAHVADHNNGHFGDHTICEFNSPDDFRGWFQFLKRLAAGKRSNSLPEFSGFVSCEMEACKEGQFVNDCFHTVKRLIP